MAVIIQLRRGDASAWSTNNPVLAVGEMGVETDTGKFKVGDGVTDWNTLGYSSGVGGDGVDGADGATWHLGEGAPADELGVDGDFYLDSTTGDLYAKDTGSWSVTMNIVGAADPELIHSMGAANIEALRSIRTLLLEDEKWKKQRLQQGEAYLQNKHVVAGGLVGPAGEMRFISLTRTGTYDADDVSEFYMNGHYVFVSDDQYANSVPPNDSGSDKTHYAYVMYDQDEEQYLLHLGSDVPVEGLLLARIVVPADHTSNNLTGVSFYDERQVESASPDYRDSDPFVLVGIPGFPMLNAPDYEVFLSVLTASDIDRVGRLEAYDKQSNGFKVRMTGGADNVLIRWTIASPALR